jgi:hypothetical protein
MVFIPSREIPSDPEAGEVRVLPPPPVNPPPEVLRVRESLSDATEEVSALSREVEEHEAAREAALRRQREIASEGGGNIDSALVEEDAKAKEAAAAARLSRLKLKAAAKRASEKVGILRRAEEAYAEQYDRDYSRDLVAPRRERVNALQAEFMEARRELQAVRIHLRPHAFAGYHPERASERARATIDRALARASEH